MTTRKPYPKVRGYIATRLDPDGEPLPDGTHRLIRVPKKLPWWWYIVPRHMRGGSA